MSVRSTAMRADGKIDRDGVVGLAQVGALEARRLDEVG